MNAVPVLNIESEAQAPAAEKSPLKQDEKETFDETKIAVEEVEEYVHGGTPFAGTPLTAPRPEEEFTEEEFKKLKRKIDWVIL